MTRFDQPLIIGPFELPNRLMLAPMAGVTDQPFRRICRQFGVGHTVSEMMTADTALYGKSKSIKRADFTGETAPIAAQIAGSDPSKLAEAARHQVAHGAHIIDINMGCPAKKVCNKLAGSALLQDEDLVQRILEAVVEAVPVPVTLKTRLGYRNGEENIVRVARYAEQAGIAALTIHGRTREQLYTGAARYELIREVKKAICIPVIANGDIDSATKAADVLQQTGADAVMIGRAAQGQPWIFEEILRTARGESFVPLTLAQMQNLVLTHLEMLYAFYGEYSGCRIARKHLAWYTGGLPHSNEWRQSMYAAETTQAQFEMTARYFDRLIQASHTDSLPVLA